jgi:hypothetical protein
MKQNGGIKTFARTAMSDTPKSLFDFFIENSTFKILSINSLNGIIVTATLNEGVVSPYRSTRPESYGKPITEIVIKLIFVDGPQRLWTDIRDKYYPQTSEKNFEEEARNQIEIANETAITEEIPERSGDEQKPKKVKTEPGKWIDDPVCPALVYYSSLKGEENSDAISLLTMMIDRTTDETVLNGMLDIYENTEQAAHTHATLETEANIKRDNTTLNTKKEKKEFYKNHISIFQKGVVNRIKLGVIAMESATNYETLHKTIYELVSKQQLASRQRTVSRQQSMSRQRSVPRQQLASRRQLASRQRSLPRQQSTEKEKITRYYSIALFELLRLHEKRLVHGDLHMGNILINKNSNYFDPEDYKGQCEIIDFGQCKPYDNNIKVETDPIKRIEQIINLELDAVLRPADATGGCQEKYTIVYKKCLHPNFAWLLNFLDRNNIEIFANFMGELKSARQEMLGDFHQVHGKSISTRLQKLKLLNGQLQIEYQIVPIGLGDWTGDVGLGGSKKAKKTTRKRSRHRRSKKIKRPH